MKVLHFYKTYYPDTFGGVEQFIYQLAEGMKSLGVESEVLALSPKGGSRGNKYANHVYHNSKQDLFIASTGFSLSAFSDFKELAAKADIINYHFPWPFMDIVHFASQTKKPTVLTYHSDIVKQKFLYPIYKPLMYKFLSNIDRIVASSQNYLNSSQVLNEFNNKTTIIPIGINKENYLKASDIKRKYWKDKVGENFFLFTGALRYYKGLHTLLEALKDLDFPLVIVGSGPLEKELKYIASMNNLKNTYFAGAVADEDKIALLELSGYFVFPSHLRSEAFGISLLEAAMYGKPLISCEIQTGTTFINIDKETGITIPPDSPQALRNAMITLKEDKKLAMCYGNAAKKRYNSLFTSQKMAASYFDLYNQLLV
ncbi:glycosyltransferase [Aquitalea aquatilis]|uniref:glycosyltransferase n=1 Tax=Aquitalea aquatilis TaxID=1537400 RepID=UPI0010BE0A3E|nr:glycosyltransferase [Aquitalea aquatilis]